MAVKKNKKAVYLVLPLVVLVWGYVFYQLFTYFVKEPNVALPVATEKIDIEKMEVDTFSILADYRDPFLGKVKRTTKRTTTNQYKGSANPVRRNNVIRSGNKPVQVKEWPEVVYQGMIKNNNSQHKVGIIQIDGQEHLVRKGDQINEMKIVDLNKGKIEVKYGKETKQFTR